MDARETRTIRNLSHEKLNDAAGVAEASYNLHHDSCPYCRANRVNSRGLCTRGEELYQRTQALEAEQERRSEQASIESEQAAERRSFQS